MSSPKERIAIEIVPINTLTPPVWDQIWELTERYVDTTRAFFEAKLQKNPEVILFRTQGGRLIGVTALDVYRVEFGGRQASIIFTSSVVVEEGYRRQNLTQRIGFQVFLRTRLQRPFEPIYFFFDTFSYKSYIMLRRNFTEFWPRYDRPTPAWETGFIDYLAQRRYGAAWQPQKGIVERSGQKRLKSTTAPIDDDLLAKPDISFFVTVNPGHQEGDMLVCLCPLSMKNWGFLGLSAVRRMFRGQRDPSRNKEAPKRR